MHFLFHILLFAADMLIFTLHLKFPRYFQAHFYFLFVGYALKRSLNLSKIIKVLAYAFLRYLYIN
jgi:hypothetical protein